METKRPGKPLLIATLGLATLSYATSQGCSETVSSGNLLPPPADAGLDSGNVLPPMDAAADSSLDAELPTSGNLIAPPPLDASADAELPLSGNLLPPPDASAQ